MIMILKGLTLKVFTSEHNMQEQKMLQQLQFLSGEYKKLGQFNIFLFEQVSVRFRHLAIHVHANSTKMLKPWQQI